VTEEAATLVMYQVELIRMLAEIVEDAGAVLTLTLVECIRNLHRLSGGKQPATDARAVASRDGRSMSRANYLALQGEQHLLGAARAFVGDRE